MGVLELLQGCKWPRNYVTSSTLRGTEQQKFRTQSICLAAMATYLEQAGKQRFFQFFMLIFLYYCPKFSV